MQCWPPGTVCQHQHAGCHPSKHFQVGSLARTSQHGLKVSSCKQALFPLAALPCQLLHKMATSPDWASLATYTTPLTSLKHHLQQDKHKHCHGSSNHSVRLTPLWKNRLCHSGTARLQGLQRMHKPFVRWHKSFVHSSREGQFPTLLYMYMYMHEVQKATICWLQPSQCHR